MMAQMIVETIQTKEDVVKFYSEIYFTLVFGSCI